MNEVNFIRCDLCNKNARFNLQKVWVKYILNTKGNYSEDKDFNTFDIEEPVADENLHFCKKCFDDWSNRR